MVSLQHPFGFSSPTAPWGVRGTRTASYCATPETDGLTIISISAMPHYKDRTHEELRLEDYELGNGIPGTTVQKGSSLPFQNQWNAFQRPNSPFGPVPSSHSLSGSLVGPTFGTATTALVSDSSVKPQFSCMSTGCGVASSTQTFNFNSTPATLPSFSMLGITSSPFGVSNVTPSTASSGFGTSTFGFPCSSVPEGGLSFPSFNVSTAPGFDSTSSTFGAFNNSPSAPSTASSGFGISTSLFSGPSVPEGGLRFSSSFGSTSSPFGVSTTPGFCSTSPPFGVSTTPAFCSANSPFGVSTTPGFCSTSSPFGVSTTPAFCSTSSPFGVSTTPGFCSISSPFGVSTTPGFCSTSSPFGVSTTPGFCSTSSPFGVSNMQPSAPSTARSGFGISTSLFSGASVPEGGLRFPSAFGSTSSPFGISTTPAFCSTSSPFGVSKTPGFCSASSPFGVSNMPPSAPSTASSGFGISTPLFSGASVSKGGLSFPSAFSSTSSPFGVSTTPAFCSTSVPFGVSNVPPSTASSGFGTSTFRFPSWPTTLSSCSTWPSANSFLSVPISSSNTVAPGTSNNPASTTSLGSLGTTSAKYGVASFSATREDDSSDNKFYVGMFLQSISAMPSYKDKSHEELRAEDYGLGNTGGPKLLRGRFFGPYSLETSDTPNQSSVHAPFSPFQNNFSGPNRENSINPSNAIVTAPIPSPPVNSFCCTNVFPSQSQSFTLQPDRASVIPTWIPKNSDECSKIPNPFTSQFSLEQPSVIISPSKQSTSVSVSDPWSSIAKVSQPQQTAEIVGPLSNYHLNNSSQASSDPTTVQFPSLIINGQHCVPSSTLSVESSPVVNPFATRFPVDQPYAVTPRQHGISSMPVLNNLSSKRTSLMRIRHVSSRHTGSLTQKPNVRSSETKVPFFNNEEDRPVPVAPFLPRENPRAWVNISLSLGSLQLEENSTSFTVDKDSLQQHQQDNVAPRSERHVDDVLALLPKLTDGDYYTEPSLHKLSAKEMAEAGFCSHVKDFVVGRKGYGSIKFLGETDVRHLDIKSAVQFNNREIIVYPDEIKKPEVGQHLNKAAEVSILNVKCMDKKTGKQYVEGHRIQSYKEMLIKKTLEQGAEFISYDPVEGEWKFRVQHF